MNQYLQAFVLGNAAIFGNVCMLPLYPGLFAMLAGRADLQEQPRSYKWLGAVVLLGVLSMMIALAGIFHVLHASIADVAPAALPIMYGLVFVLGVAVLFDHNPFARLATAQMPVLAHPLGGAYLYGVLLAPLTMPCTGPLIISALALGSISGAGATANGLTYFLAFGVGFGWPLVILPFLAAPLQRRATNALTRHHRQITVASGLLLMAVATWSFIRTTRT